MSNTDIEFWLQILSKNYQIVGNMPDIFFENISTDRPRSAGGKAMNTPRSICTYSEFLYIRKNRTTLSRCPAELLPKMMWNNLTQS